jgi:Flp pilus assembly protein TadG
MFSLRSLSEQRGTSTIEMILVLPVFLFLLFGIAEIARLWHTVNIVTTAARDGARVGAATSPAAGEARIDAILTAANLAGGASRSVTCLPPCVPDAQVQATVTVTFQTQIPLLGDVVPALGGPIPVVSTTIMRRE